MSTHYLSDPVAEIVQSGPYVRNTLWVNNLCGHGKANPCKRLILLDLTAWLAALDDFRNWLIQEAA